MTDLAESGAGDEVIRDMAGHVSKDMLKHYSHIRTEAKRRAVEGLSTSRAVAKAKPGRHLLSAIHPTPSGFVLYAAALIIMGFVHEFSHAIVARSFGVNVPSLGIMLSYFQPAFYVDVSGISLLREHGPRINVLLAGVMANNLLLTLSLFAFVLTPVHVGAYFGYFALMNAMAILLNLIPLIESDGHFILKELLDAHASPSSGGGGRATLGQFRSPRFPAASAVFSTAALKRRILTWKRKMMR